MLTSHWLILVSLGLFYLGAILGSFLHVFITRSIEGRDWVKGRSCCDSCGHQLAWYDNIPLLSFIWLRGCCRYCGVKIDTGHLLLELLTGALFTWWFWGGFFLLNVFQLRHQPFVVLQPLFWLMVAVLLLITTIYDLRYLIIPEGVLSLFLGLTVVYRVALVVFGVMQPTDLVFSLIASALTSGFLVILWLTTMGRGIGLGDVKLVIPLSLLVGWSMAPVGLIVSFILGSVISLILLAFGLVRLGKPIPFGPYLILGFSLSLVWGEPLLNWYLTML